MFQDFLSYLNSKQLELKVPNVDSPGQQSIDYVNPPPDSFSGVEYGEARQLQSPSEAGKATLKTRGLKLDMLMKKEERRREGERLFLE